MYVMYVIYAMYTCGVWCVVCGSGVHVMLWCCEKYMSLDCNYETYSSEVL